MKYNIGDILKIKEFHSGEIKYIVITNHYMAIGQPAYEYVVQGIEGITYWDIEIDLDKRIMMAKENEISDR